jgi:hypothetical protein
MISLLLKHHSSDLAMWGHDNPYNITIQLHIYVYVYIYTQRQYVYIYTYIYIEIDSTSPKRTSPSTPSLLVQLNGFLRRLQGLLRVAQPHRGQCEVHVRHQLCRLGAALLVAQLPGEKIPMESRSDKLDKIITINVHGKEVVIGYSWQSASWEIITMGIFLLSDDW